MKALIGKKIGMTRIFKEDGSAVAVTIFDVSNNVVSKHLKDNGDDSVSHIELGKDSVKKPNKADSGNYKELAFVPKHKHSFKVKGEEVATIGTNLNADVFSEGDKVTVTGVTKGKGFQGVVKRWKMAGGAGTHGASDRERSIGSIGARMTPGRVFKGHRMSGHMGMRQKSIKGLVVVAVMPEDKLIAVSGSVPGSNGSYLLLKESKK